MLSRERLSYLLNAYSGGTAIETEEQELFAWINETGNHELLRQHIRKLTGEETNIENISPVDWDQLYQQILDKCDIPKHRAPLRPFPFFHRSAAAAALILIFFGAYLVLRRSATDSVAKGETAQKPLVRDVPAPSKTKAVLTLADGRKIELDSIGTGTMAQQGNVQVVKQADGKIVYHGVGNEILYNTLDVPRGSKVVTIKLSDDTQVWLNSESSLRYPASFSGPERAVEITGEAYFEVAHNAAIPFVVKKGGMEIRVLGTRFNINAYEDERISKLTLLEGSVKVSINNREDLLKPGQQAQISDGIKLVNGINIEEVMAWKNGIFQFGEKADLQLIMRKIARWYDVDVEYGGTGLVNQRFGGEIPMNSNLSQVLEILRTSGVKFALEGKKVVVRP